MAVPPSPLLWQKLLITQCSTATSSKRLSYNQMNLWLAFPPQTFRESGLSAVDFMKIKAISKTSRHPAGQYILSMIYGQYSCLPIILVVPTPGRERACIALHVVITPRWLIPAVSMLQFDVAIRALNIESLKPNEER